MDAIKAASEALGFREDIARRLLLTDLGKNSSGGTLSKARPLLDRN